MAIIIHVKQKEISKKFSRLMITNDPNASHPMCYHKIIKFKKKGYIDDVHLTKTKSYVYKTHK